MVHVGKIVCCLTSHPGRIKNCYRVVKSLLENTVVPDRVYLTLSRQQFTEDIDDLPPLLRKLVIEDKHMFINWVDVDTKKMKSVVPVLQFLDDDDLILGCDDDILYPSDYIETRISEFNEFGGVPLTGLECSTSSELWANWGIPGSSGMSCAFQKRHVENIDKFVDECVIATDCPGWAYSMVEWLNGFSAHDVSKYGKEWLKGNCTFNETSPTCCASGNEILDVFRRRICGLVGMDIIDEKSAMFCKGFFKQK